MLKCMSFITKLFCFNYLLPFWRLKEFHDIPWRPSFRMAAILKFCVARIFFLKGDPCRVFRVFERLFWNTQLSAKLTEKTTDTFKQQPHCYSIFSSLLVIIHNAEYYHHEGNKMWTRTCMYSSLFNHDYSRDYLQHFVFGNFNAKTFALLSPKIASLT